MRQVFGQNQNQLNSMANNVETHEDRFEKVERTVTGINERLRNLELMGVGVGADA